MTGSLSGKAIALSLGRGLTTVAVIVSAAVMSRLLTLEELATYRQSLLAFEMVTGILSLGIAEAVFFYLPVEKVRRRGIVLEGLLILGGLGALCSMFFLVGGNFFFAKQFSNPSLQTTLIYFSLLPVLSMPATLLAAVLVTQNRVKLLAWFSVFSGLFLMFSLIFSCWYWRDPFAIVLAKVITQLATGFVALGLIWVSLPQDSWLPSLNGLKEMFFFSLPLGAARVFGIIQISMDKLLVSSFCQPSEFAIYSNGALEIPIIGIVTGSIATVILPDLRKSIADGNTERAISLFRRSAEKSAVFLIPLMIFLLFLADPVIRLLYSEKYQESVIPFRIYLLLLPARVVMYGSIMIALGLNKVVLYVSAAGALVNAGLGYVLVNQIGSNGAAISTVLSMYAVICFLNIWAICKAMPCSMKVILPYRKILELIGLCLVAALPLLSLDWLGLQLQPAQKIGVAAVVYLFLLIALAWLSRNTMFLEIFDSVRMRLRNKRIAK
jgi:O-antigen/teichoic acid export membrane protein